MSGESLHPATSRELRARRWTDRALGHAMTLHSSETPPFVDQPAPLAHNFTKGIGSNHHHHHHHHPKRLTAQSEMMAWKQWHCGGEGAFFCHPTRFLRTLVALMLLMPTLAATGSGGAKHHGDAVLQDGNVAMDGNNYDHHIGISGPFDHLRPRKLQQDTPDDVTSLIPDFPACNTLLHTLSKAQVATMMTALINGRSRFSDLEKFIFRAQFVTNIKHGVEIRRVCASCDDIPQFVKSASAQVAESVESFCGADVYGSDVQYSGLLVIPIDENASNDAPSRIVKGPLRSFVYFHTTSHSFNVPSIREIRNTLEPAPTFGFDFETGLQLTLAAHGAVMLAPDFMGYAESYDKIVKGYILRKSYETSSIPLWFKAKEIVRVETMCESEMANVAAGVGFSEGGYAGIVVMELLSKVFGVDVVQYYAGGVPAKLGSAGVLSIIQAVVDGTLEEDRRYNLAYLGVAYSSTHTGAKNYNVGQDFLATHARENVTRAVNESYTLAWVNDAVPLGDELSVFNDTFTKFALDNLDDDNFTLCHSDDAVLREVGVELLCDALKDNELLDTMENIQFPLTVCQSPDDEIVSIDNLPDFSKNANLTRVDVTGRHTSAGLQCILNGAQFAVDEAFLNYPIQSDIHLDNLNCDSPAPSMIPSMAPTPSPTSAPTNATETGAPTSAPTNAAETGAPTSGGTQLGAGAWLLGRTAMFATIVAALCSSFV